METYGDFFVKLRIILFQSWCFLNQKSDQHSQLPSAGHFRSKQLCYTLLAEGT